MWKTLLCRYIAMNTLLLFRIGKGQAYDRAKSAIGRLFKLVALLNLDIDSFIWDA